MYVLSFLLLSILNIVHLDVNHPPALTVHHTSPYSLVNPLPPVMGFVANKSLMMDRRETTKEDSYFRRDIREKSTKSSRSRPL